MSSSSHKAVEVVDAGSRTPWKPQLVGSRGYVVESRMLEDKGTVYKVAGLMEGEGIWFAGDCLKRIDEELEESA